jgi:hypothetical protein
MSSNNSEVDVKKLRKFVRVEPEEGLPIRVDINGDGFIDVVNATDISQNGIGVQIPHQFANCKTQSEVSLIISLPDPVPCSITVNGIIRQVFSKQFGIMFTDLNLADQEKIRRYVHHRLRPTITRKRTFWDRFFDWFEN